MKILDLTQIKKLIWIIMIGISFSCSRERAMNWTNLVESANANDAEISEIMNLGCLLAADDVAQAGIELKEGDSWAPTGFNKQHDLSRLIGHRVTYVLFYYKEKKFTGMLMRVSPDAIFYRGSSLDDLIEVSGRKYKREKIYKDYCVLVAQ